MNTAGHEKFIMTPISKILEDANRACVSLGFGIESQPLASYVMQTTFLRMTGASEQKLKCICWEIATADYNFRYELLKKPLGECSSYDDKKNIFKSICDTLTKNKVDIEVSESEKDMIIATATTNFDKLLENSHFSIWFESELLKYKEYVKAHKLKRGHFCNLNANGVLSFIDGNLVTFYKDVVYRTRNRYAHNLMSYQLNVPTLTQLSTKDYSKNNHFRMFSTLILMDGIFMTMFSKFLAYKTEHCY